MFIVLGKYVEVCRSVLVYSPTFGNGRTRSSAVRGLLELKSMMFVSELAVIVLISDSWNVVVIETTKGKKKKQEQNSGEVLGRIFHCQQPARPCTVMLLPAWTGLNRKQFHESIRLSLRWKFMSYSFSLPIRPFHLLSPFPPPPLLLSSLTAT